MTAPPHALETFVDKARRLYTLPAVAMEVLQLTNNPQVDTRALRDCIENDPALTTKILRVVNSSLFGLSREVSDLNQALALLGTKPLKLLVLGFSLPDALFTNLAGDVLARYWQRTLIKAVAARELAERFWRRPGDEPFIAGLLQDLGMLALIQSLGATYVQFLDRVAASGGDLLAMEVQSLGFDHTQLSSRLLENWGLPPSLVSATRGVQSPDQIESIPAPARTMPQVLHLAELLARVLADRRQSVLLELLFVAKQYRSLSRPEIENLVAQLQEKVEQLADVLSLELPEGMDYRDVLVRAYEQMSDVAAESAGDLIHRGQADQRPEEEDLALLAEVRALAGVASQAVARARSESSSHGSPAIREHATHVAGQPDAAPDKAPTSTPAPVSTIAAASTVRPTPKQASRFNPLLGSRLATAVTTCRLERWPLSLLLVGVDRFEEVLRERGPAFAERTDRAIDLACGALDHAFLDRLDAGEGLWAVVLPDCDRSQAVQYAGALVRSLSQLLAAADSEWADLSLNVGAATVVVPPKNFPAEDLVDRASRCLYAARASGGGVKSIEII